MQPKLINLMKYFYLKKSDIISILELSEMMIFLLPGKKQNHDKL